MRGHMATRPKMANSAGSRVRPARIAKTTPIAVTGPSARLDSSIESNRHSRPAITVVPEARTAGNVPFQATRVASQRDSV